MDMPQPFAGAVAGPGDQPVVQCHQRTVIDAAVTFEAPCRVVGTGRVEPVHRIAQRDGKGSKEAN